MKAFYLIPLLLFLLSITSHAQSYKARWSEELKTPRGSLSTLSMVGTTSDAYHIFSSGKKGRTLQSYTWSHRLTNSQPISFDVKNEDQLSLKRFIHTREKTLGVFIQEDRKTRERHTYVNQFEADSLTTPQLIYSSSFAYSDLYAYTSIAGLRVPQFDRIETSPDSSLIVFASQSFNEVVDEEALALTIQTYDEHLSLRWETTLDFPYKRNEAGLVRIAINELGEVYALMAVDNRIGEPSTTGAFLKYRYELLKVTPDTTLQLDLELTNTTTIQYADIHLSQGNKPRLVLAGMYTDIDSRGNLKGAFHLVIDENFSVISKETTLFSDELIRGVRDNSAADQSFGLNERFAIQNFFTLSTGELGFIAEETFSTEEPRIIEPGTKTLYHTNKLLIVLFSPRGEVFKEAYVEKDFASTTLAATSFVAQVVDDQLVLIFNDDKTRAERAALQLYGRYSAIPTDIVILNKYLRETHRQLLFTNEVVGSKFFLPQLSYTTKDGILLYTRKDKNYQFGLLRP